MKYPNKLAEARNAAGLTQQEVAEKIGITVTGYQNYEYGKRDIRSDTLRKLSDILDCSAEYLVGLTDIRSRNTKPIDCYAPLVGRIAAGTPLEAIQLDGESLWVDPMVKQSHPHAFFLTVHGDSMNLRFPDGCNVLVDPDERRIVSGKIYAVLVNGNDATLKQVFVAGDTVVLHPLSTNSEHRDHAIDVASPDAPYFAVVGRVVWASWAEE